MRSPNGSCLRRSAADARARCSVSYARRPASARAARRGGRADLDRVARDLAAARALGQALELVGRLVDRLQMALVLELLAGRGEVGVPDLGQTPARQLDVALAERRLELEEKHPLFEVEDVRGH